MTIVDVEQWFFATIADKDLLSCVWRLGQMHAPRIHSKEHMHTEKTRLQHQIWPQKRCQFSDLQFVPFPIEGWFWGPLIGLRNGPRNWASFPPFALSFGAQYLVSMAAAATILCVPDRLHHQRVYLLKVSLRNHNHMRSRQLLRLQPYTHTQYIYIYKYLYVNSIHMYIYIYICIYI